MNDTGDDAYYIVMEDVRKSYDGKKMALDGLTFKVRKGEIYGLLGKNGAGKSTSIKIMTTLIGFDGGEGSISGYDIKTEASRIRRVIGVVQQEESFDFTSVENNFKLSGMLWEVPKKARKERMEELMDLFGLQEMRKKRMYDLSGGQKKRVQVAREFMHDMNVLFLDEPTVGLDPIMRRKILSYIRKRAREGLTVLFTTQNLEEADMICDRIGIINDGRIVAEGTSEELKTKFGTLRTLKLTATENMESVAAEIRKKLGEDQYEEIDISENRITILGKKIDRSLGDILETLAGMDISIDNVSIDNPTLDDVFMKVVQK
ncbi:MAG: ABC transporter ATP-binding protein [Candidatus Thermoplasmatota archaeon]|nr:ABC transporter ATP-binding protein [Candidatus Thermoplasmatota archaeon]